MTSNFFQRGCVVTNNEIGQMKFNIIRWEGEIWSRETRNIPLSYLKAYFDILNRLGVTRVCDGQTDGQIDSLVA